MNILVAISGYQGDQHQIENNWPAYAHHGHPIVVLSPEDAPIEKMNGAKCVSAGEKGWIGPHTLRRHHLFLRELLSQRADFYLFHDADSVCLAPEIPKYVFESPDIFWSNEVTDTNPAPSRLPKIAMQPPYMFSRHVLRALVRACSTPAQSFSQVSAHGNLPLPTECIDHFQLQIVYSAGISHRSFPDGASFETTSDHGFSVMREHVGRLGKVFLHSIKKKHVLEQLFLDRRFYLENRA